MSQQAMKIYHGIRRPKGEAGPRRLLIEHLFGDTPPRDLPPRNDLANHSPDGFNWGYGGSGPAQTALAILADALEDDDLALRYHQRFKAVLANAFGPDAELYVDAQHVRQLVASWVAAEVVR
jgi:hypothetical protein